MYDVTFFYVASIFILTVVCIILTVLLVITCCLYIPVCCTAVTMLTLLYTLIRHSVLLPLYSVHYFLFHAFTKHKLWVPHQVPVIPKPIISAFWGIFNIVLLFTTVIVWVLIFSGLYLRTMHSHFVTSPDKEYHNKTMKIPDGLIHYDWYL